MTSVNIKKTKQIGLEAARIENILRVYKCFGKINVETWKEKHTQLMCVNVQEENSSSFKTIIKVLEALAS